MINEKDPNGNTPLHIAIERGSLECVRFLLEKKADITIKNKEHNAALHYCIICSKPDILELIISKTPNIDLHIAGDNGATPLHICAYFDNLECAMVLIKYNTNLCQACPNGFFPIHVAANRCSNKVLKYLLDIGGKSGCSKFKMLSFVDGDNNKPLHAAVQVCNMEAVKICLDNGASIDETTEPDRTTAVHIACAQGSLEILKLLFEKQPELKDTVIHMQDINLMTPLHKAAMFDHLEVVEYLIEKGAGIDMIDKEKRRFYNLDFLKLK